MTTAEQLVEALVSRRPMNRRDATTLVRDMRVAELNDAADRFDRSHRGLIRTSEVVEQLNQDADAIRHGDPMRGVA